MTSRMNALDPGVEPSESNSTFVTDHLALAAFLGSMLLIPILRTYRGAAPSYLRWDRGPPTVPILRRPRLFSAHDPPLTLPLRR